MSHLKRILALVLVSAMLIAAAAPAAQAHSLRKPPTPRVIGADWLDAALSWLSHLFGGAGQAPEAQPEQKKAPTSDTRNGPGNIGPTGTNCIDPNGGTGICELGGTGG